MKGCPDAAAPQKNLEISDRLVRTVVFVTVVQSVLVDPEHPIGVLVG